MAVMNNAANASWDAESEFIGVEIAQRAVQIAINLSMSDLAIRSSGYAYLNALNAMEIAANVDGRSNYFRGDASEWADKAVVLSHQIALQVKECFLTN